MNSIEKNSKEIKIMNNMKTIMTRITTFFVLCMLVASQSAYAIESVTYFHHDALGSTVAATDEVGDLLWTEEYKPYGGRLNKNPASSDNNTWYTGKQEGAYGLTYFGARWYDNEVGRFMAIDPVGFKSSNIQSFNRYTYANNNPYAFVDPDGREAGEPDFVRAARAHSKRVQSEVLSTVKNVGETGLAISEAINPFDPVNIVGGAAGITIKSAVGGVKLLNRSVSKIDDITKSNSKLPNIKTDVSKSEFEKNLLNSGFTKSTSKDGNVNIFTDGSKKYTTRSFSKSTNGPTAEVFRNNRPVSKIRLGD